MEEDVLESLHPYGNTVYVCLGNDLREDDGAGTYISRNVKKNRIKLIDAGGIFENSVSDIIELKPDNLVIIDAAFFDGKEGEIKILDEKNLKSYKMFSTHSLPLNIFLNLIREDLKNINIIIVGIQAKSMGYREGLSTEVKKSCDEIIKYLNSL